MREIFERLNPTLVKRQDTYATEACNRFTYRVAENGRCRSEFDYGNAIINLHVVASRMTPEQIAEAQKLAREWKPKLER